MTSRRSTSATGWSLVLRDSLQHRVDRKDIPDASQLTEMVSVLSRRLAALDIENAVRFILAGIRELIDTD